MSSGMIGLITAVTPIIIRMLKTFDPNMFPRTISLCFFMAAIMQVDSSGNEVPMAMTVRPIMASGMPAIVALVCAPLTRISAPAAIKINPAIKKKLACRPFLNVSCSSSISCSSCWYEALLSLIAI